MKREDFKENNLLLDDIKEINELIYEDYDRECLDFFSKQLNQENKEDKENVKNEKINQKTIINNNNNDIDIDNNDNNDSKANSNMKLNSDISSNFYIILLFVILFVSYMIKRLS
jgi:hypothetical protein